MPNPFLSIKCYYEMRNRTRSKKREEYNPRAKMEKELDRMTAEELKAELERLKDSLCDLEDMHSFTFGKTSVHIGAEKANSMQAEFEEECRQYRERIARIEETLRGLGAL